MEVDNSLWEDYTFLYTHVVLSTSTIVFLGVYVFLIIKKPSDPSK